MSDSSSSWRKDLYDALCQQIKSMGVRDLADERIFEVFMRGYGKAEINVLTILRQNNRPDERLSASKGRSTGIITETHFDAFVEHFRIFMKWHGGLESHEVRNFSGRVLKGRHDEATEAH